MDNKVRRDIEKKKEQYRKNVQVVAKAMEENDILEKRIQRLENLDEYYKRGERAKRAHRLITKGAAIEHLLPESKDMEDADFFQMMQKILSSADAKEAWKAYQEMHPRPPEGGDLRTCSRLFRTGSRNAESAQSRSSGPGA